MGLLSEGTCTPLSWEETKKHADFVKKYGLLQFLQMYHKHKHRHDDSLKWGDEVEYFLVKMDHEHQMAKLFLGSEKILHSLQEEELSGERNLNGIWRPEYGSYMVESSPAEPYNQHLSDLKKVEKNMKNRRLTLLDKLSECGAAALTLVTFPRFGCPSFTYPECKVNPNEGTEQSQFLSDKLIYQGHPRFLSFTRNIRDRRDHKVDVHVPVFKDEKLGHPFLDNLAVGGYGEHGLKPDHIYLDSVGFGMSCASLQVTFQAQNLAESLMLFDQLVPMCPIMLALSAASPIRRGYLSDLDCRWSVLSACMDDRTDEELGLKLLRKSKIQIPRSRCSSVEMYISPGSENYNDINVPFNIEAYEQLTNNGINDLLAKHISYLFLRDPITLYKEKLTNVNVNDNDHFENIQSTVWQTLRFKPPPTDSLSLGWRVEFRPMEVQITDFENAAYAVFMMLLTRVIFFFSLNFLIPITKVDENMERSQKRNAVLFEKFYFRKNIFSETEVSQKETNIDYEYSEMTLDEIINGKEEEFPGLINLIQEYLNCEEDLDIETSCLIQQYLNLIKKRASGETQTAARWMRNFVQNHPEYSNDSIVSDRINYDLIRRCNDISLQTVHEPSLIPNYIYGASK